MTKRLELFLARARSCGLVGVAVLSVFYICAFTACQQSASSVPATTQGENKSATELIAEADKLYAGREDLAQVRRGVAVLRRASAGEGGYDARWRLAKFDYYLGAHTPDGKEQENAFREGIRAGEAAVAAKNEQPDGHFWLGANLGGEAERNALKGLSDADKIRREMETVIRLDEGYQSGSAYMVLGQIELALPRLLGGDPQRAVERLEQGLRFGQDNAYLHLRLAEAYKAVGRAADARKQLTTITTMKPNPDYVPEYNEAVAEAKKELARF